MAHESTAKLTQIGAALGPGEIKQRPNDDEVEWRGQVYNLPTRLKVDAFQSLEGMIKFTNPHGTVNLNWDPDYVNDPGDADAWSDDDTVRVFVGRGVCVETFASNIDEELAGLKSLPPEQVQHLIGAMIRDRIARVYIRGDEFEFGMKDDLNEWGDAMNAAVRFTQMAGWCCGNWQAIPANPAAMAIVHQVSAAQSAAGIQGAPHKMTCRYCRSVFLLGPDPRCANCGAPAQG